MRTNKAPANKHNLLGSGNKKSKNWDKKTKPQRIALGIKINNKTQYDEI